MVIKERAPSQHVSRLIEHLQKRIGQDRYSFRDYMEEVLYQSPFGYYTVLTETRIGDRGGFLYIR